MVLAVEFLISSVQVHPGQGYRGGDDPSSILRGFCHPHLGYGQLIAPDNVPFGSHRFWKSR